MSQNESKAVGAFVSSLKVDIPFRDSCHNILESEIWVEHSWQPRWLFGIKLGYKLKSFGFIHLKASATSDFSNVRFKEEKAIEWQDAIFDLSSKADYMLTVPTPEKIDSLVLDVEGCIYKLYSPAQ